MKKITILVLLFVCTNVMKTSGVRSKVLHPQSPSL